MSQTMTDIDQLCVSTLRFLSVDMVQKANSGHPGLPLGAAPMAYALWSRCLKHNPADPTWFDRDRFILSAGHGSALLYSLLHVFGYGLAMDELKRFRQLGSLTPGHPEFGLTPGVEATTGPLGQGLANAVGMAIAEAHLAARYNVDGITVVDHFTYALVSDGDLMEGVAAEAVSLAGHLRLGKLIALYDDNRISLDGPTQLSFSEDVERRFEACGWQTLTVNDGNDLAAIESAIRQAQTDLRPSLISVKTHIGYGSPKQDTSAAHGSPLGTEAVATTKANLGWLEDPTFHVPDDVMAVADRARQAGNEVQGRWQREFDRLKSHRPDLVAEIDAMLAGDLPAGWDAELDTLDFGTKPTATRTAGKTVLNAVAAKLPWLIGGAADLASSTKTHIDASPNFDATERAGRNLYYGVREHAMGAIVNGMTYHGLRGYGSTFLVFSDYMRGAIRVGALSNLPILHVFTHDSVCVGEDGPTHEPVEHVAALRVIPNLMVYRPADAYETAEAWRLAVGRREPAALILTRQDLPVLGELRETIRAGASRGGYVLRGDDSPHVVLIATGSEVSLALAAADRLVESGMRASVVSMICVELFDKQDAAYRESVLPSGVPKVAIEAGVTVGWWKYVGSEGEVLGIDRFGESAPGEEVYAHLGMTIDHVVEAAKRAMAARDS